MPKKSLKQETDRETDSAAIRQFCSFRIKGRLYGINILDIKEVTSETVFTPVYHAPPEVRGYLNLRGQINLVIDLRKLLGFESKPEDENSCVVLFKPVVGELFGILVDSISDVVEAPENLIEGHFHGDGDDDASNEPDKNFSEITSGVCKLENELMEIISARHLLNIIDKNNNSNK